MVGIVIPLVVLQIRRAHERFLTWGEFAKYRSALPPLFLAEKTTIFIIGAVRNRVTAPCQIWQPNNAAVQGPAKRLII
jgi:hypothetical protein